MKKKIFIVAGEKSGDLLGSKIAKQLNKEKFEISGVGGEMMKNSGVQLFSSINDISVMGIFEVLPKLFKILKKIKEIAKHIIESEQDIVLTIDAPDFCFRVAKLVKKLDKNKKIKFVHFIAPSVWVYRKNRAKKIAKIYDLLFCILPFEPPYFKKYGLKSIFVGHPIFDKNSLEYEFNKNKINYNPDSNIISITSGSRKSEVKVLLPIILDTVEKLMQKYKNLEFHILATENTVDIIKNILQNKKIDYIKINTTQEEKNNILANSLLAIAKSGTNTLEIAGYSIPIVVIYKFNFFTNLIAKFIKMISTAKYVNIINVIAKKENIPELILDNCNSKTIFEKVCKLIDNKELRLKQIKTNLDIIKILGYNTEENNSIGKVVDCINSL